METKLTLLWGFIGERVGSYAEPTKAGTAIYAGESIGYMANKYQAVLLTALTGVGINGVAEACGVSYDLVKKWHTEPEFKQRVGATRLEFTNLLFSHLVAASKQIPSLAPLSDESLLTRLGIQDLNRYGLTVLLDTIQMIDSRVTTSKVPELSFWVYILGLLFSPAIRQTAHVRSLAGRARLQQELNDHASRLMDVEARMLQALFEKAGLPKVEQDFANVAIEHLSSLHRLQLQA